MEQMIDWNGKLHIVFEHLGNRKSIAGIYIKRENAERAKKQLQKQSEINIDKEDYIYKIETFKIMDFLSIRRGE